jgi:hypothetical protein
MIEEEVYTDLCPVLCEASKIARTDALKALEYLTTNTAALNVKLINAVQTMKDED